MLWIWVDVFVFELVEEMSSDGVSWLSEWMLLVLVFCNVFCVIVLIVIGMLFSGFVWWVVVMMMLLVFVLWFLEIVVLFCLLVLVCIVLLVVFCEGIWCLVLVVGVVCCVNVGLISVVVVMVDNRYVVICIDIFFWCVWSVFEFMVWRLGREWLFCLFSDFCIW